MQVGLTPKEMADLDGADGTADGKFHGVDIADLKHDLGKSTEGWEQRPDGKWYKRDYYSASKVQAQVAVTDERDQIIATLRRDLAEKDAIIAELRSTITAKVQIITRLEAERTRYLAVISQLEEQLRVAQANQQIIVQQPVQPVQAVAVADNAKSYYVVHSQRGADLLSQYGKRDIVIQPQMQMPQLSVMDTSPIVVGGATNMNMQYNSVIASTPPPIVMPSAAPLVVSDFTPVVPSIQMEQIAAREMPVQVQTQQFQIQQQPAASASMSQQEYYRVADEEARRRLDMMDGKLDGKLDGTDIRITGGASYSSSGARAAGMIAGGAGAAGMSMSGGGGGGSITTSSYQISSSGGGMGMGGGMGLSQTQQEYYRVADEEARRRLDMMDGKMDGKFQGTEIQIREGSAFTGAGN